MHFRRITFLGFLTFCAYTHLFAQENKPAITDSLQYKKKEKGEGALHVLFKGKPGKALSYSLLVPGLGQIYNHHVWKAPIVYAALGTMGGFIYFNKKQYDRFNKAFVMRVDLGEKSTDEFQGILTSAGSINVYRKYYDHYLQLSYIGFAAVYLLNGIEAFIDRHLQSFDVSDNLGFEFNGGLNQANIGLSYKF